MACSVGYVTSLNKSRLKLFHDKPGIHYPLVAPAGHFKVENPSLCIQACLSFLYVHLQGEEGETGYADTFMKSKILEIPLWGNM